MRKRRLIFRLTIAVFLLMTAVLTVVLRSATWYGTDAPPPAGWRIINDLPNTRCAYDTPFQIFQRDGPSDNLTIYFQSGGACWDGATCAEASPSFDHTALDGEINEYRGVFDFENPLNPIADDDVVFVPYCTADVHLGDTTLEYETLFGRTLTVHHNGFNNVMASLNWVFETYPDPERVLLTGSSAGAIASIYYADRVMDRYADSRIIQFADGYVGVAPPGWDALDAWNAWANRPRLPAMEPFDSETFTISELYSAASEFYPQHTFAQYTHAADALQIGYYLLTGGNAAQWAVLRDQVLDSLAPLPNFRSFVGAGVTHTILFSDEFYTMRAEGVFLRDWLTALINGDIDRAPNVHCFRGAIDCP